MFIKKKNIINITKARNDFLGITKKVQKKGNYYIFTKRGKAKMLVMSAKDYDSLMGVINN